MLLSNLSGQLAFYSGLSDDHLHYSQKKLEDRHNATRICMFCYIDYPTKTSLAISTSRQIHLYSDVQQKDSVHAIEKR